MTTKCTALWKRMLKNVSDTQTLQSRYLQANIFWEPEESF